MQPDSDSYAFSLAAILLTFAGLFMFADASTDRNRIASAQTQACCAERDPKTGQCIRRERCAVEVADSPVAYQAPFTARPEKHADTKDPDAKMCKALPDIGRLWINVKTDKVWECVGEPHIPVFRWEERKGKAGKVADGAEPAGNGVLAMTAAWEPTYHCEWKKDAYICNQEVVGYVDRETDTFVKPTGYWYAMYRDRAVGKFTTRDAAKRRVEQIVAQVNADVAIDKGCHWGQDPVNGGMVVVCPTPKKLAINEGKCLPPGCCLPGNRCPA